MSKAIVITAIIVTGIIVLAESALIAFKPDSASELTQTATLLAGLGVSTFVSLRGQAKTRQEVQESKQDIKTNRATLEEVADKVEKVRKNTNGNMSELIAFAKDHNYSPERIAALEAMRAELDLPADHDNPDDHKASLYR